MEKNQILTADLLDIIFDNRNKAYGAYDLRVTYPRRVKQALLIMFSGVLLVVGGTALAMRNNTKPAITDKDTIVEIHQVTETKPPPKTPEPVRPKPQESAPPVAIEKNVTPRIVPDDEQLSPPPQNASLEHVQIGDVHVDGAPSDLTRPPVPPGNGSGIIEQKPDYDPNEIVPIVEIEAKYDGNWEGFLRKNLRPEVPVDKDAPAGRYRVEIKFVVDVQGNISNVEAKTNNGYGMEEEAMRVIRKAKWVPAYQNGHHVKAYRTQVIIFEVVGSDY